MFFIAVAHVLSLLWQLNVSIDLQWEKEKKNRPLLLSHYRYFDKFYRNFHLPNERMKYFFGNSGHILDIELKSIIFAQFSEFDWLPWQPMG